MNENFLLPTKLDWLRQSLQVTKDVIKAVADATVGQGNNALWSSVRKLRFTASRFGELLRAVPQQRQAYV